MFLIRLFSFMLVSIFIGLKAYGTDIHSSEKRSNIRFIENKNQWEKRIIFWAQLDGGSMFLEKNCFTYNFQNEESLLDNHSQNGKNSLDARKGTYAFRMTFLNSLQNPQIEPSNPTSDYCNFFLGNDPDKWVSHVKKYSDLKYMNLYPNINLEITGYQNSLKYNFIIAPLGNPNEIKMSYEGLKDILLQKGSLRLKTGINEMIENSPFAYQWIGSKKVEVPCEFVLVDNLVSFNFPQGYNKGYELIIDPEVVFSASSGSIASNFGHTCTYDPQGNLYSGGIAFGAGYPFKLGYDPGFNGGNEDVVITKYSASGDSLIYSTYLGGKSDEIITSMIVDAENNLVFYGVTGSDNFPIHSNAYSKTFNKGKSYFAHRNNGNFFPYGTDIFVCKFDKDGLALLGSTYMGGTENDGVNCNNVETLYVGTWNNIPIYSSALDSLQYNYGDYYRGGIELDKFGNVYVATSTRSKDFPRVAGYKSYDTVLNGQQDAIVFKMNSDLSNLIWSTYLGGSNNDAAYSLVLDDFSNVYVAGGTRSDDFPKLNNAFQTNAGGGIADGYVTKIKNDGSDLLASTYFGTINYDQVFFVQLDKKNNVYLFGQSEGKIYLEGNVYGNPNSGQFITKMSNALTDVIFSTVIGNNDSLPNIAPTAFLVDACENIYIAGWTGRFNKDDKLTLNMPVTKDSPDSTTTGSDFYLMVLTKDASTLLYSTYWGGDISGEHVHGGTSRFDKRGIVYQSLCTGCGGQDDYPLTNGAYPHDKSNPNGSLDGCNNAVFKIDFKIKIVESNFTVDKIKGCAPLTVHFKNESSSGKILWDFGNNDTTSIQPNPVRIFTNPGTYLVKLFINDSSSCNLWDTTYQIITVYEPISADFDFISAPCSNEISFKDQSTGTPNSWEWDFGDGTKSTLQNPIHQYKKLDNVYTVKLISQAVNGCRDSVEVDVNFVGAETKINPSTKICKNAVAQLSASGGFSYSWTPVIGLNNPFISNPTANPDTTTTYKVNIKTRNALGDTCESVLYTTVTVMDPLTIQLIATSDKDTVLNGESTYIHAITDTTLQIYWTPQAQVKDPSSFTTMVMPTVTTTYTVTINDSLGCSKSAIITIYVVPNECEDENVFVPNTFTPNGDGQNDILYARSNNLTAFYFAVYNRWGELVFETSDLSKGWDGVYKGTKADPAVFAWYVKGKCFNGKEFFKKGNVTLIR